MTLRFWIISFAAVFFWSCSSPDRPRQHSRSANHYALGFEISVQNGIRRLTVKNPWEQARNVAINYYLVDKNQPVPDSLAGKKIIRTPVERIVCLSTSHLAFLEALGEDQAVTGISGAGYISSPFIRQAVDEGRVADVGYGQNLNYEEIIRQAPDAVMVYGVDSEITGFLRKFEDLGIPAIMNAEYLEETPLGKAEWIRFVGALFNKEALADSLFRETESRYQQLTELARQASPRPAVLVGLPYRDSWWVPGGRSYLAHLIEDAGGNYSGRDNPSHESYVISFEEAFTRAATADIWLNVGMVSSKAEILAADARFANFPVFRNGRIFNNNQVSTEMGGNDFWESGTVHPDRILSDLIQLFHPGLLPPAELFYYKEIK